MTPTLTPQSELDTIRAMARADHAQRLTSAYNPYPQGTDKAAAWDAGWREENDASHRLDEEIVKLPRFRVRVEIVEGRPPGRSACLIATISRLSPSPNCGATATRR